MWNWINFVAAALGAIGGPAALWAIYLQRPPRLRLQYHIEDRPAFPGLRRQDESVEFELNDREAKDPHQVRLLLRPDGRRDIRSEHFDGQELTLHLGAPIVALLDEINLEDESVTVNSKAKSISIAPQLLKSGLFVSVTVVVDGKPEPKLIARLADVEVESFDLEEVSSKHRLSRKFIAAMTSIAATMLFLSGFVGWRAATQANEREDELIGLANTVNAAVANAQAALKADPRNAQAATGILDELQRSLQANCYYTASDYYRSYYSTYYNGFYGASPGLDPACYGGSYNEGYGKYPTSDSPDSYPDRGNAPLPGETSPPPSPSALPLEPPR